MEKLIIAGARYKNGNEIAVPHFTGESWMVDCDRYIKLEQLSEEYDEEFVAKALAEGLFIEDDDETYFYATFGPLKTKDFELLSDLSNLRYEE